MRDRGPLPASLAIAGHAHWVIHLAGNIFLAGGNKRSRRIYRTFFSFRQDNRGFVVTFYPPDWITAFSAKLHRLR